MKDLTIYSDSELSNVVFSDEHLYTIRHSPSLWAELDKLYIYSASQAEELEQDLEDDLEG